MDSKARAPEGKLTALTRKWRRLLRDGWWRWLVRLPPARTVTVSTQHGRFSFDSRDQVIGKQLFVEGEFEFDLTMACAARLSELGLFHRQGQGTVLDVGGHIGTSAVTLLREGWFKKAVAFEPSPANFGLLQQNIAQNGLGERLIAHRVALSDHQGELELEMNPTNSGDNRIRPVNSPGQFGISQGEEAWPTVRVPVDTLDGLLAKGIGAEPEEIRLVWMDIQGHEGEFFRGAKRFFQSHPHVPVVTEFWPYGLSRSGVGREEYGSLVGDLFSHFLPFEDLDAAPRPIAGLDAHFDRYGALFSQMLFFNR